MSVTSTDIFAGAGGSSTGLVAAGIEVKMAANHWPLAVDVHQRNHPSTAHDCADVTQVDPRRYPHTDMGWFSPECTNHTNASGRYRDGDLRQPDLFNQEPPLPDAARERSRSTMWDVVRFAEYHRYPIVLVENVVEAVKWAPFQAWLQAMESLDYKHEIVCHNSMHSHLGGLPAPQSRDRLYVAFWSKKMKRPSWERAQQPLAYCEKCDEVLRAVKSWKKPGNTVGKYRSQYLYACPGCASYVEPGYSPASSAIDWSIEGTRIGDRVKPLSAKTMARIRAGLERWGRQPTLMRNASHRPGTNPSYLSTPVTEAMRTILADGVPQSLLSPAMVVEAAGNTWDAADPKHPNHGQPGGYIRAWDVLEPLRTLHTTASKGIVCPPLLVPVEGREGKVAQPVDDPYRTITTRNETALLVPYYGRDNTAVPVDQSMPTVTTEPRHGLLVPYNSKSVSHGTTEPMGTVTTVDRYGLVIPRSTNTAKPVSIPMDTVAASGNHHALADFLVPEVEDCVFRMLEPHEYAAGMAFPDSYIWDGTKRERVKMAGNAVTPPMARDLGIVAREALEAAA